MKAVYDDGPIYHALAPLDEQVDDMGWTICLCGKHLPGLIVDVPAITCIECLAS